MAFVAAVAFATILAVVAGLTIAASSAFAHDIWWNFVRNGAGDEREQVFVARAAAVVVGVLSIVLSIALREQNVAFLVGLAFAVAASANVPALVLALTWKRFSRAGAIAGMSVGLVSSLVAIALSPASMGDRAVFPLRKSGAPVHSPRFPRGRRRFARVSRSRVRGDVRATAGAREHGLGAEI